MIITPTACKICHHVDHCQLTMDLLLSVLLEGVFNYSVYMGLIVINSVIDVTKLYVNL